MERAVVEGGGCPARVQRVSQRLRVGAVARIYTVRIEVGMDVGARVVVGEDEGGYRPHFHTRGFVLTATTTTEEGR